MDVFTPEYGGYERKQEQCISGREIERMEKQGFKISIRDAKPMTERLVQIAPDKAFCIEVLKALQNQEQVDAMREFIDNSPALVRSEVYDYLVSLTDGAFSKGYCELKQMLRSYLKGTTELSMLLDCLKTSDIHMPIKWNLTPDEKKQFENASFGDSLHIETKEEPIILKYEGDGIAFPIFTSEYEAPGEWLREGAWMRVKGGFVTELMMRLNKELTREVVIYLDHFSDECLVITADML